MHDMEISSERPKSVSTYLENDMITRNTYRYKFIYSIQYVPRNIPLANVGRKYSLFSTDFFFFIDANKHFKSPS